MPETLPLKSLVNLPLLTQRETPETPTSSRHLSPGKIGKYGLRRLILKSS